jgi:hypothetical protein
MAFGDADGTPAGSDSQPVSTTRPASAVSTRPAAEKSLSPL